MLHRRLYSAAARAHDLSVEMRASMPNISIPPTSKPTVKLESVLICNELDAGGNMHVSCGRFLKSALCAQHGLLPRDLRKLDGTLRNQMPVILVRQSALLVHLTPLRAIIKHDGVIFFEPAEMGERLRQHEIELELQQRLKTGIRGELPFELVCLEFMLQRTLQNLQESYDGMAPAIEEHLRVLEQHVHWDRLKILLECKKSLTQFQDRVNSIKTCISEVLESDDDMAAMYLSQKAQLNARPVTAHEEVELLLESYLKTAEELASRAQLLCADIQATEDIVNIGLVGQRNELLLLELKLGIATFATSIGAFGASVLGMNLPNHLESSPHSFYAVLGTLLVTGASAFVFSWRRMLRLIRRK